MMSAQANILQFSPKSVLISSFIMVIIPVLLDMAFIKFDIDDDELPKHYWLFNVIALLFNICFYMLNAIFLWIAFTD